MPTDDTDHRNFLVRQQTSSYAFGAAIGAAVLLYYGFGLNLRGISSSEFYNLSVNGLTWVCKLGGIVMALLAALLWIGLRPALLADAIVSLILGLLLLAVGGIWIVHRDFQGLLFVIFGAILLASVRGSWQVYRDLNGLLASPTVATEDPADPPPVVPADPAARQEAMERLMASKKREVPAEPPPVVAKPAPQPLRPLEKIPPLARNEPPPEGFLAELGREDDRKEL